MEQAIPKKHKHLVERFKLGDWKGMMEALDDKFGGSRKIVTSVLLEVDKMKVPNKDEQFLDIVERIKKIEKDLDAVDLKETLQQETILMKLENLLPENINRQWLIFATQKRLLKKTTSTSERYDGFMEFLDECYEQAEWHHNGLRPRHNKSGSAQRWWAIEDHV